MLCVLASGDDSIILQQRKTYFDRYIFKAFQVAMLTSTTSNRHTFARHFENLTSPEKLRVAL